MARNSSTAWWALWFSLASGITDDSSDNCHNTEEVGQQLQQQMFGKSFFASKMKRKDKVMTLEAMPISIVIHGQEGIVIPSRKEWYAASCKAELICHLSRCMSCSLPLFYYVFLHCSSYCWHRWYKLHQKCLKFPSWESMLTNWPRWLSGHCLPLIITYASCMHYIICHVKQGAKATFGGYNQQLSTKSVEKTRRAPQETYFDGFKYAD